MKQKNFLKIAFCFLLISNFSYGQLVTTIDFETENSGYTPSATEGSTFTDVFNRIDRTNNALGGNSTAILSVNNIEKFHINYQPSLKLKKQLKGHVDVLKQDKK